MPDKRSTTLIGCNRTLHAAPDYVLRMRNQLQTEVDRFINSNKNIPPENIKFGE